MMITILTISAAILVMVSVQQCGRKLISVIKLILVASGIYSLIRELVKCYHFSNKNMQENANSATILHFGSHFGFIFTAIMSQNQYISYRDNIARIEKQCNEELQKLTLWFHSNLLSLNVKKTTFMIFSKKKNLHANLFIENVQILKTNDTKFFEVILIFKFDLEILYIHSPK